MSKNAPDFGAYARFVQVSAPFFCTLRRSVRSRALRNYDLDMDALATVCSWETNGIMI